MTGMRVKVKQILNRNRSYSVAAYARLVSKAIGRNVTKCQIRTCLGHMIKEGQYSNIVINNNRVYNYNMCA